jgi:4-hydroxythreonine-4-phosphate dehydrogenase
MTRSGARPVAARPAGHGGRRKVRLAISVGDPAGIGPEVAAKAMADPRLRALAEFSVFAAPFDGPKARPSAASGRAALSNIRAAAQAVLWGHADALVTAPISKEALHLAGAAYPGHTELLAEMAGKEADQVGMLLVGGGLRVFLVTRHMSLMHAIVSLDRKRLKKGIQLCGTGMAEAFRMRKPRLALAALNPHAGEAGAFGNQEIKVLRPVVKALEGERRFSVEGPFPADTVFVKAKAGDYDAVICLYHDQGLIPLKLLAFDTGVNVTLGLPFVRTSPDHGTAYDIVGKGLASAESMKEAVRLAVQLAGR